MDKKACSLAFLSALLYTAASPPIDIEPLGWLCLVPFLFAIDRSGTVIGAFKTGFFGGAVASATLYYWLVYTMATYGHLSYLVSVPVFLLLAAYLALFWGIFGCLLKFMKPSATRIVLIAPCLWVSLEYLRTYLFTGFPWALLGYTQYKSPLITQIADFSGVYGVSFILALSSATIYAGARRYLSEKAIPVAEVAVLAAVLLLDMGYGILKVHAYSEPDETVRVALIQGNIDQDMKWNSTFRDETIKIYHSLSREALLEAGHLDAVIWPETAAPFYFQQEGETRERLLEISKYIDAPILFGSPAFRFYANNMTYLNSAYLISPGGGEADASTLGRYDKIHLVPFGEYVPLRKILFFVNKITEGIGDFSPGEGVRTLDLTSAEGADIRFGPLICYEVIFPDLVRRFVGKGANVLVNITNDAWYGISSAPYQHLSAAALRAVENGVYMLRAANTGVTAIIDPLGRIKSSTRIFESGYIFADIGIRPSGIKTVYTRFGDLFALTISMITVLWLIYAFVKRRRDIDLM